MKSFADEHGIFGWVKWKQSAALDIEFHCHRTIDLNLIKEHMFDQALNQKYRIQSRNQRDEKDPPVALFECPKACKHHKEIKT